VREENGTPPPKPRVLIVDDSPMARRGIAEILEGRFTVIGQAGNGVEALEKARELMPDLILMDIWMPGMSGLETTRLIKQGMPYVKIVILSVSDDVADLFEAIKNGAQGYLVKNLEPETWLSYLTAIVEGNVPISRAMAQRILSEFRGHQAHSNASTGKKGFERGPAREVQALTPREEEILNLVALGATNREIAARLYISEFTVKNHLKNILEKLHLQNRVQLAVYATQRLADDVS